MISSSQRPLLANQTKHKRWTALSRIRTRELSVSVVRVRLHDHRHSPIIYWYFINSSDFVTESWRLHYEVETECLYMLCRYTSCYSGLIGFGYFNGVSVPVCCFVMSYCSLEFWRCGNFVTIDRSTHMADLFETWGCFVSIQDRHKDSLCRKQI